MFYQAINPSMYLFSNIKAARYEITVISKTEKS